MGKTYLRTRCKICNTKSMTESAMDKHDATEKHKELEALKHSMYPEDDFLAEFDWDAFYKEAEEVTGYKLVEETT